MTLKEFAEKYKIPYRVAYEATYKVKPQSTWMRDRDYPEKEMYSAIVEMLISKIERNKRKIQKDRTFLNNMRYARYANEMPKVQQRENTGA